MIRILATALFLFVAAAVAVPAAEVPDPRKMTFPELKYEIPKAERFVLSNGMVVHHMEDRELPIVSMSAYVKTGSIYEPAEKIGLASLTGAVMRSGGITGMQSSQLDDELEFMASSIEASIGSDAGTVAMTSLTKNIDRTLELYAGVLTRPAFAEERVQLAKNRSLEGIRRQNDDPKQVAERELRVAIYANHPLGRVPTLSTVQAITRDDMVSFHRTYFHPNSVVLAVSGDISRKELKAKLEKVFGGWKKGQVQFPSVPQLDTKIAKNVLFAQKDVSQSVIRMGHLGIEKSNPDLYALKVMDFILGGNGFNSRLMMEIRNNQGLAYNAVSYFDVGRRYPGIFLAETETKGESTARAIKLMLDIIGGITREPVSDAELALAKDSIINSFVFGFTKTDVIVNQRARLEFYGYPEGYLEKYRTNIANVTKDDVLRAAKKYLHPNAMTLVVVGDRKKFDQPLMAFGEVNELKLEEQKMVAEQEKNGKMPKMPKMK